MEWKIRVKKTHSCKYSRRVQPISGLGFDRARHAEVESPCKAFMSGPALRAALIWSAHFRLSDLMEKRSEPTAFKGTAEAKRHGSYFISLKSRGEKKLIGHVYIFI